MDAGAFAFALSDLGALIAAPLHFAHDDDLGEWPPRVSAATSTPSGSISKPTRRPIARRRSLWIPNWIEHDEDLSSVGVAPRAPTIPVRGANRDGDGDGTGRRHSERAPARLPGVPRGTKTRRRRDAEDARGDAS